MHRWYECLDSIKPRDDKDPGKVKDLQNAGWVAHGIIEAQLSSWKDETQHLYTDPDLPFDIGYHPDMVDKEGSRVYDIKSFSWFARNPDYCLAQISGYRHFLGVNEAHLYLYAWHGKQIVSCPYFVPQHWLTPWEKLKEITLRSIQLLDAPV